MYSRILVPVDLEHVDKLSKALDTAGNLAAPDGATLIYTGVTTTTPSATAHTPAEYSRKLEAFAQEQGQRHGVPAEAHTIVSHDPAIDLADKLIEAVKETQADCVIMASHVPGVADHMFHSNAGHVGSYAPASVFIVR